MKYEKETEEGETQTLKYLHHRKLSKNSKRSINPRAERYLREERCSLSTLSAYNGWMVYIQWMDMDMYQTMHGLFGLSPHSFPSDQVLFECRMDGGCMYMDEVKYKTLVYFDETRVVGW